MKCNNYVKQFSGSSAFKIIFLTFIVLFTPMPTILKNNKHYLLIIKGHKHLYLPGKQLRSHFQFIFYLINIVIFML